MRITRLAVSAIAELSTEGLRLRDHKCVMMAIAAPMGRLRSIRVL